MITAIIIDDQKDCRELLKKDIASFCLDINVIGEAGGVKTGIVSIYEHHPELVFLDVNMNDGTGFDLLEIIAKEKGGIENINFKIIFTTAYEEFAVKAFKYSAIDYLLKPIIPDDLINAVEKIKTISNLFDSQKKLGVLYDNLKNTSRTKKIVFSTLDSFCVYNIDEIIRCEAQSNYTKFYFSDGKNILVSKTMKEYEDLLTCHDFERVHLSHIINLNFVKKIIKSEGGQIIMSDNSSVPLSSSRKKTLLEKLGNI
ncbi:MAG: response regulator transcription factor [Bacteroidetes bacterium]|nr:response regulator transcription factor [Bacteroidota bacterium]